jgi:hypothetical protein
MLGFGVADALLQMQIIAHEAAGPLIFAHYLFFLYSPFLLSGLCALLFAVLVAYPFRDVLLARGWTRIEAAISCGLITLVGSPIAYWIILAGRVAITSVITKTR